jgi:predicted nucleic acid-binding Zn ribbon protein
VFELFQSITEPAKKHLKTECKECNNKAPVRRLIGTGGGIIFKGSGFYQTDYRSEGYKKAAEADKPSTENKPKETSDKPAAPKTTDAKETKKKPTKPVKGGDGAE